MCGHSHAQTHTPTSQKRKFNGQTSQSNSWACNAMSGQSDLLLVLKATECDLQYSLSVLRSQAEEQGEARTKHTAAGLLVDCSQEQWEHSEVTGWCYDTDAVKCRCVGPGNTLYAARLCGSVLVKVLNGAMVCFQHGTSERVACALELKSKQSHRCFYPNQHVTYLHTAVWILHKLLSKYQKLRITIQSITMLNSISEKLLVKLLVWMWRVKPYRWCVTCRNVNYDQNTLQFMHS